MTPLHLYFLFRHPPSRLSGFLLSNRFLLLFVALHLGHPHSSSFVLPDWSRCDSRPPLSVLSSMLSSQVTNVSAMPLCRRVNFFAMKTKPPPFPPPKKIGLRTSVPETCTYVWSWLLSAFVLRHRLFWMSFLPSLVVSPCPPCLQGTVALRSCSADLVVCALRRVLFQGVKSPRYH